MNFFSTMLKKSYYKTRIIFTFSIVTIILLVTISFTSYNFIRNLYLDEISTQVKNSTQIIANQIDESYLDLLSIGPPTKLIQEYFKNIFKRNTVNNAPSEIFIFDKNLIALVHSEITVFENRSNPNLIINKKDIEELAVKQSFASLPFKGDDGDWYLWGFYRLDENSFLAVKESAAKLQRVEEFANIFFYFGLIATLITIIVSWLIAKSITKPVDKLINFSNEIGKGNFKARPPENMRGEIKLLSTAMEKMKNDLFNNQKELEYMLAQIAHEIRNPLGGIELFANLIKEDLNIENKNTEKLDKILKEVNGLKKLITEYLNYSKPKKAAKELINLHDLMNDVNYILKPDLDKKNVCLNYDLKLTKVWFDREHLRQIMINLISNSLNSISNNGLIKISSNSNYTNWWISVSDNGRGISKENIDFIFDPFFTTKSEGTGLGLSICKKLAIENNASIEVVNNEERGCTFTIFGIDNKKQDLFNHRINDK